MNFNFSDIFFFPAIVYEILYRKVFHLHSELEEAVHIIREQNKNKNKNGVFPVLE